MAPKPKLQAIELKRHGDIFVSPPVYSIEAVI